MLRWQIAGASVRGDLDRFGLVDFFAMTFDSLECKLCRSGGMSSSARTNCWKERMLSQHRPLLCPASGARQVAFDR